MINSIDGFAKRLKLLFLNFYKKPNENAIWIFGFQKSGTSAIAALFAKMTDKSVTIDTVYLWEPFKSKMFKVGLQKHVNKYSFDFSKDIIKEPGATLIIPTIKSFFKLEKYIFIVRNPYDNVRSILNRLNLPGNKEEVNVENLNLQWRKKFKGNGKNYVLDLAQLWLEANNQPHYMNKENCVLVKYEDFMRDKVEFIENLAKEFTFEKVNDISNIIDNSFQPRGNPKTNLMEFFGQKNIDIITQVCGQRMSELGYNKNEILNK